MRRWQTIVTAAASRWPTCRSWPWFTGTGASAAHFTFEGMKAFAEFAARSKGGSASIANPHGPPQGVAVFAADNSIRPRLDPDHQLASWTEYDRGGHFPAMETPDLLVGELRRFFGETASKTASKTAGGR